MRRLQYVAMLHSFHHNLWPRLVVATQALQPAGSLALSNPHRLKPVLLTALPSTYGGELGRDADQDHGSADAEFGEVFQLRDANSLIGKIRAVGRIHIAQADDISFNFNGAVPARNFFVIDDDIGVGPSHDDAWFFHRIDQAARGA